MCLFITTTLPSECNIEFVAVAAKRNHLSWAKIENKIVLSQLEKGSRYFYTTRGMCDCGTELGSKCDVGEKVDSDFSSHINLFQKKGWSASKIEKWLAEKEKMNKKKEKKASTINSGQEIEHWMEFITDILKNRYTLNVGILLHSYTGGLEDENIQISKKTTTALPKISKELFLKIEEDHLYLFALK